MNFRIEQPTVPIDIYGRLEPVELISPSRLLYLDDKLVPPAIAEIFFEGLNVITKQYIERLEKLMEL